MNKEKFTKIFHEHHKLVPGKVLVELKKNKI